MRQANWFMAGELLVGINMCMRFYEFARSPLKPIKPLNPREYAIAAKKRNVQQAKDALKREKETQRQQAERERQRKALQRR